MLPPLLLLLAALPALVGGGAGEGEGPVFLPTRRAVVAAPGGAAQLACRVARLGDTAVSWVRARDLHILAHAGAVFSADPRVAVTVTAAPAAPGAGHSDAVTHTLRLSRLRAADAGRYECQLNTDPKRSQIYDLVVTDEPPPRLEVRAAQRAVRGAAGGAATLGCEARLLPAPSALAEPAALRIDWFHEGRLLEPQSGRAGGVSLETELRADGASARLTLAALAAADAGAYRCRAAAGALRGEAAVALLLDDAEAGEMEAMQRDQGPPAAAAPAGSATAAPAALLAALAALAAAAARL